MKNSNTSKVSFSNRNKFFEFFYLKEVCTEKNCSLNFTELFNNCADTGISGMNKENLQNFLWQNVEISEKIPERSAPYPTKSSVDFLLYSVPEMPVSTNLTHFNKIYWTIFFSCGT